MPKKSKEMKKYLRMAMTDGCPECKSDDTVEMNGLDGTLFCLCNECGYTETCPEQPKKMKRIVMGFASNIRDENGDILPEFL